jgi:hypothetical protein
MNAGRIGAVINISSINSDADASDTKPFFSHLMCGTHEKSC